MAIFSTVKIPDGTKLAPRGFYLLGLSNSGLAVAARAGDTSIHVRSTIGMSAGDMVSIDTGTGTGVETRKIVKVGTPASNSTTLWQPLPDGPIITIPVGTSNVPVMSASGFVVGEKIAVGYGATYPAVASTQEQYEVATVTAVVRSGTQAYLAVDAPAGATNLQVTSTEDISVGDKIRLDIESAGHGIETVTITRVGTPAHHTNLSANAPAGLTHLDVRSASGFAVGDKISIGTSVNHQTVTVTGIGSSSPTGGGVDFTPALEKAHGDAEGVVVPGTGLELASPLRFNHAENLPFSNRGTGITFEPATAFAHSSNEPVQALGTGITLDSPLAKEHPINAVVRDAAVKTAGYQGAPEPNQWFGGPVLTSNVPFFERTISLREGSMVLRDGSGLVVDSLNYGGQVDPWAAEGYQAASGSEQSGCHAPAPGAAMNFGRSIAAARTNTSAGRFPDGADTASNCGDFFTQAAATLSVATATAATNIKVESVEGFKPGQTITIDTGAASETAVIATVGTAGATTAVAATAAGATIIPVAAAIGFRAGETITIDTGANAETAAIASIRRFGGGSITFKMPLAHAHAAGAQVSGTGINLTSALTRAHAVGAQVADYAPTPGAPNQYHKKR